MGFGSTVGPRTSFGVINGVLSVSVFGVFKIKLTCGSWEARTEQICLCSIFQRPALFKDHFL